MKPFGLLFAFPRAPIPSRLWIMNSNAAITFCFTAKGFQLFWGLFLPPGCGLKEAKGDGGDTKKYKFILPDIKLPRN